MVVSSNAKVDFKMDYIVVRMLEETRRVHISEIGVLMLESTAISITAYALCELLAHKVKVIFCDRQRNPCGELLPSSGSHDSTARIRQQTRWTEAAKAAVWTEIVRAKIARQRDVLREAERRTLENTGLRLNIAINYGARAELARAARQIAQEVQSGTLDLSQVDEKALSDRLYTHDLPDVDLLIRTSGEMRLSNFLLYQCAYAEFLFPTVLWPDFTVEDYHRCIAQFQGRKRRFGKREE